MIVLKVGYLCDVKITFNKKELVGVFPERSKSIFSVFSFQFFTCGSSKQRKMNLIYLDFKQIIYRYKLFWEQTILSFYMEIYFFLNKANFFLNSDISPPPLDRFAGDAVPVDDESEETEEVACRLG